MFILEKNNCWFLVFFFVFELVVFDKVFRVLVCNCVIDVIERWDVNLLW